MKIQTFGLANESYYGGHLQEFQSLIKHSLVSIRQMEKEKEQRKCMKDEDLAVATFNKKSSIPSVVSAARKRYSPSPLPPEEMAFMKELYKH